MALISLRSGGGGGHVSGTGAQSTQRSVDIGRNVNIWGGFLYQNSHLFYKIMIFCHKAEARNVSRMLKIVRAHKHTRTHTGALCNYLPHPNPQFALNIILPAAPQKIAKSPNICRFVLLRFLMERESRWGSTRLCLFSRRLLLGSLEVSIHRNVQTGTPPDRSGAGSGADAQPWAALLRAPAPHSEAALIVAGEAADARLRTVCFFFFFF